MLTEYSSHDSLTVVEVLAKVFGSGRTSATVSKNEDRSIQTIFQGGQPRWIIVGASSKSLPVLSSWAPWKTSSRIRWNGVRLMAKAGLLSRLPGIQTSAMQVDTSFWRARLPYFPEQWSAVIHVGNVSHSRKAILFLVDDGRRVVSASKIPLIPGAVPAIFNEAKMLDLLKRFDYLPRVLFRDEERGIASQSWLDGHPVSRGFSQAHLVLLESLVRPEGIVRVSDYREGLSARLDASDLPFDRAVLRRALDFLDCDTPLRSFVEHRDFAPWNLKWLGSHRLGLLDWEWGESAGLPWQDACQYFYVDDVHFGGAGHIWERLLANELLSRYCRAFEIPSKALPALTMRYLLRDLFMQWEGKNMRLAEYSYSQILALTRSLYPVKG